MRIFIAILAFVIVTVVSVLGFRGNKNEKEPIFIFPDMDRQAKYHPQGESGFFNNGMADRPAPVGTVSRGTALDYEKVWSSDFENEQFRSPEKYTGKTDSGEWASEFPYEVNGTFIELGAEKDNIFCSVCHGVAGDGRGITGQYGLVGSANFHADNYRQMPHGEIYNTIRLGKNTMMGYGDKLSAEERWAVVAYVRVLQQAFYTQEDELTPELKATLGL